MAFDGILSQIKLLFGLLVSQLVWYILKQLFTSVSVKLILVWVPTENTLYTERSKLICCFVSFVQNVRKPANTGAFGDNLLYLLPFSLELIVFVGAGVSILFILTTLIVYALIRYAMGKKTSTLSC